MLPEYILEEDEKVIISSKLGMVLFTFYVIFFIFLTAIWTVLMCFYVFEHEIEALRLACILLPFPLLILGLLLAQTNKKIFLTNKNVIVQKRNHFQKIKFEDITLFQGYFPPKSVIECLRIQSSANKKLITFININGFEIEQKFKELCPSYQEPEIDWNKESWTLAILILILVFIPLIIAIYSIAK